MSQQVRQIAQRLIATRAALGLSQAAFADGAGIARNTYNQWERERGRPELDEALKLCRVYSLTLDWIYLGNRGGLPFAIAQKLIAPASSSSQAAGGA